MAEDVHRPLAVYRFSLTPADRLAFAMLRRELTGWEKFRLIVIIGISGMMAGVLPEHMRPVAWWAAVALILSAGAAAAILWSNLEIRRKASALDVPKGEILVEEWGDHLVVRSDKGTQHLGHDQIGNVVVSDAHVFILLHGAPVIVPLRAFEDRHAMRAFAEVVDKRSQDAVP
jgi:hypothetical protein